MQHPRLIEIAGRPTVTLQHDDRVAERSSVILAQHHPRVRRRRDEGKRCENLGPNVTTAAVSPRIGHSSRAEWTCTLYLLFPPNADYEVSAIHARESNPEKPPPAPRCRFPD